MKYNLQNLKTDFYEEVNKDWLKKAKIPADRNGTGGFVELDLQIEKKVIAFADKLVKNIDDIKDNTIKNFAKFYKITSDHKSRNQIKGSQLLLVILREFEVLQSYDDIAKNFKNLEYLGSLLPFQFGITQDFVDNTKQVLAMGHPNLILPDKAYYANEEKCEKLLNAYREMMIKLWTMLGFDEKRAKQEVEQAIEFDKLLIEMAKSSEEEADYVKSYNVFKFDDINQKSAIFDVKKLGNALISKPADTVIVDNPRFIDAINSIYTKDNFHLFKSRMICQFIAAHAQYLSDDFRETAQIFRAAITGTKKLPTLKKFAFQVASGTFRMPFGIYYAKTTFGAKAKENVEHMVDNMIGIYKNRLRKNTWLSKRTIEKAITKLEALEKKIGYPEEYESFYDEYETLLPQESAPSILKNILKFRAIFTKYAFAQYLEPVNKNLWEMSPAVVNAYFHPFKNVIVFPAAILDEPFYSLKYNSSANYGGIGSVIAHEISHAFDNNGSQFDEKGNLNNWWTDEDRKEFKKRAQGVIDLFEGQDSPYGKCNGKLTVSENIADLGGFACAYEAAKLEPDFDAKSFFYNWANVWRSKYRKEYGELLLKSDVHAPTKLRANIQIKNHDAFYEVFGVKASDAMFIAPEKRVKIW
ncbi:Neutral endopeptidase [Mycoplasmopsis californica]|uniref:M13 family metallopeptidase n=1 Tax=Mycoplasmopsis equigenitalium TaxID=114883 RepID=A0ABY5J3X9_9BACT|nr:M13 family metallopeptidase [Mycoplasmopsis equigenitalium]UUD36655.1 M13 family metallopeptidase [Mycoplasmopsis equigenitalium]VEU69385.1 Neutral endopeptidase [Mycoplasmopsis californica]